MGKGYKIVALSVCTVLLTLSITGFAQEVKSAGKTPVAFLKTAAYNFTTFTLHTTPPSSEWLLLNKDYSNHPDAGFITPDNPVNAIELISKRTADSRYFINKDTASMFYMVKANTPINYQKDKQWLSIDQRLCIKGNGLYEAGHQPEPTGFDMAKQTAYINSFSGAIFFNNWQLTGQKGDQQTLLAIANWSHFSAGDDGIKITDIFPGIDAEMIVERGSIKTSFIVRKNEFKGYDQLLFTDEFKTPVRSELVFSQPDMGTKSGVDLLIHSTPVLHINSGTICVENTPATTELLDYSITGDHLSMLVNETDLDTKLNAGTVMIDPQVSVIDSIALADIGGSMNNGNLNLSCNYLLPMNTPAKATFEEVAFQFGFNTYAPATNGMGDFAIGLGTCNTGRIGVSIFDTGYSHPGYASTMKSWDDMTSVVSGSGCMPSPSCTPQNIVFNLQFYNTVPFGPSGVCSDQYVSPHEAFQILIVGETLGLDSVAALDTNTVFHAGTICQTDSVELIASGKNGVPPYNYNWDHGAGDSSVVRVSPPGSTTYTVTITDQCNNQVSGTEFVNVIAQVTPSIRISASSSSICNGTQVDFSATIINGGSAPVYQWLLNGSPVGTNGATYSTTTLSNGDKISCVLTSSANCKTNITDTSNIISMIVMPIVTPSVTIAALANGVCGETPISFTASAVNVGATPAYQWQVNNISNGPNDSLFTTNTLVNGEVVDCIVTASTTGCYTNPSANSNQVVMNIRPVPGVVLTATKTVIANGDTTSLNAAITGGYTSFAWTPSATLSDATITNPVADPIVSTTYQINITDTDGCVKNDSILIGVFDPIFIPTAFTPNGDGHNDIFRIPPTINFDLTKLAVYDRWGKKIFETEDITQGWDGTFQGNKCDAGAYVYIITGYNAKGKLLIRGSVTLFR